MHIHTVHRMMQNSQNSISFLSVTIGRGPNQTEKWCVPHHNWPLSLYPLFFDSKSKSNERETGRGVMPKTSWFMVFPSSETIHKSIWLGARWEGGGGYFALLFLVHWKCEQCSDINNIYLFGVWSWSLWYESVHSRKQHNIKSHTSGYTPHSLASAHIAHMCALSTQAKKSCNTQHAQYTVHCVTSASHIPNILKWDACSAHISLKFSDSMLTSSNKTHTYLELTHTVHCVTSASHIPYISKFKVQCMFSTH